MPTCGPLLILPPALKRWGSPIRHEELEEFVNSRGGQIVSADDPANPQKCTMVRGIMWQLPLSSTNRLHLTCTDPEVSQGQAKDEAGEEVAEDEGKAEDDSDNEMFQTSKEAVRSYRDKGFRFKHTESELCRAMCCTSRPLKGPCGPCPALAKVRRDTSSEGQWYVDVITPHTDDCPHHTDFKVRGAWLHGGAREIIQTEYFEHRKTPMEIADTLRGGVNMTIGEFTETLDAWPRSSDSPDEVILLDYRLTPFMSVVFTTNRFLETARLIYAEQQQMGIPPWCWLDGTGRVIWQRTRVLLLGGLTANHTTAVFVFSLTEREKKEALHFTLQTAKNAMETRFPGFKWDLGMFMSDGAEEMINAARAVWLTILWLLCCWHAQKNMREHLKENVADKDLRPEVHANLRDLHLSWSTPVWQAGWVALEDHYSATPHYLDHAREQYIHKRRKWATFLSAFGSLAFAIAPLYSTFIRQDDFVSCHPACLLMLHCALSRRVVKGE